MQHEGLGNPTQRPSQNQAEDLPQQVRSSHAEPNKQRPRIAGGSNVIND